MRKKKFLRAKRTLAKFMAIALMATSFSMSGINASKSVEEVSAAEDTTYYAGNPIITSMFTADPSAHVWEENGTIYIYASHDIFPSRGCDLMDKYHVFSSTNMVTWKDEGEILSSDDVPWGRSEGGFMWAPDAAYENGTYYFYFPHPTGDGDAWNSTWRIGVATSSSPASGFTCAEDGYIKMKDGSPYVTDIDPCVFKDDDGTYYLYTGGGAHCQVARLEDDMMTLAEDPVSIEGTLTDFHEGMWVFKKDGKYYALYADNTTLENQMRYSTADSPYGPWKEGGVVLEGTGCDTSHGSIVEYKGHWYLFYHNCEISGNGTLRSVCIDEVYFNEDGSIQTVVQTDKGVAAVDYVDPNEIASSNSSPDPSNFTEKTNYSISSATIGGGATLGSGVVENLHYEGSYVEWNNVNGGKGGQAMLTVYYGTPDGATALVNSSGDTAGDGYFLKFDKTTGWSDYSGVATCFIDLNAGTNNTVKLTCGMGGVNITGMSISLVDQSIEQSTTASPTTTVTPATTVAPTTAAVVDGQCDLVVTDIYTDTTYYPGEEAQFVVKIKNQGTAATPSGIKHGLLLYVNGTAVNWCDTYFDSMQPGEEATLVMNYGPNNKATWTVPSAGTYTVQAWIDDQSLISESNEDNNRLEKSVTFTDEVATPDEVTGVSVASPSYNTISVVWASNENKESRGQVYNVYVDGVKKLSNVIADTYTLDNIAAGNHTVKVTAVLNGTETAGATATVVVEDEPIASSDVVVEINGYQISTTVEGFRTVYSVSDPNNEVVSAGMLYGVGNVDKANMVYGATGVYNFGATDAGKLDATFSSYADAQSYSMTMQFAKTASFYTTKMNVRAYAKLSDGTYVYSDVEAFTVYYIADFLYQNLLMNNLDGHDYLYNNILKIVDSSYEEKDFAWNNSIVKPGDAKVQ